MKRLLPICLGLVGAMVGGFPEAVVAFHLAVGTGISASPGEAICYVANLLLSVGGAFVGMRLGRAILGQERLKAVDVLLPILLGLICGTVGYLWLDWAISHANPPL